MRRIAAFLAAFAALPAFAADWNPRLAADYLDARQKEWFAWPVANKAGVPCISCHTGATYLLARPALRKALNETQPTPYETGLLDSLRSRLDKKTPKDLFPKSTNVPQAAQAAAVEAIFAGLFLGPEALDRMWSLQLADTGAKGAWAWDTFDLDPWEMPESTFYGAALAAMATGAAPAEYRNRPEVRQLTAYLQRELPSQPLHNRLIAVWAATKLPDALAKSTCRSIIDETWKQQQRDGGWTIESLGPWKEHPKAPHSTGSNSYATGLTAFILQEAGAAPNDPRLTRALDWLKSHQDPKLGYWDATSLNKPYAPDYMPVLFMRDAATAYASLALLEGMNRDR